MTRSGRLRPRSAGARPPLQAMEACIDEQRETYGVEPICRVLPIGFASLKWRAVW
jgi:hypothetical protein